MDLIEGQRRFQPLSLLRLFLIKRIASCKPPKSSPVRSLKRPAKGGLMAESFIHAVVSSALANFDTVMAYCGMAGGKDQAREYLALNPKRADSKLGSLAVNRDTGAGGDFATGETWGDLVAMTAWRFDCSQIDAAERLADLLGIPKPNRQKRATSDERGRGNASTPSAPK